MLPLATKAKLKGQNNHFLNASGNKHENKLSSQEREMMHNNNIPFFITINFAIVTTIIIMTVTIRKKTTAHKRERENKCKGPKPSQHKERKDPDNSDSRTKQNESLA